MNVHVFPADWRERGVAMREIRTRVFVDEQRIDAETEFDGRDDAASHFLAVNEAGQTLGTARLLPSGEIGHIAVLVEQRKRGIGGRLLEAAVAAAVADGIRHVFAYAPIAAQSLFRRAGFTPVGEVATASESLLRMARQLPAAPKSAPVAFDQEGDCRAALDAIVGCAHRQLAILSPSLEDALFATRSFVAAVSELARRAAATHVRILVEDPRAIAEGAHRLLELARRLPSKIEIRRLPDDDVEAHPGAFVVADEAAYWMMPDRDAFAGVSNVYDRVEARRLVELFDRLFARSVDDPELRLLTW